MHVVIHNFFSNSLPPKLCKKSPKPLPANFKEQILNLFDGFHFLKGFFCFIWIILPILTFILRFTIEVLVLVWLKRKISIGIQQCIGPKYAHPLGIIQALMDGTELLLNEDIILSRENTWLFHIGPIVVVIPIFLSYLVIPFGHHII